MRVAEFAAVRKSGDFRYPKIEALTRHEDAFVSVLAGRTPLRGAKRKEPWNGGWSAARSRGAAADRAPALPSRGAPARRGCEKIGTGTSQRPRFPIFSRYPLGASPIFSQPRSVTARSLAEAICRRAAPGGHAGPRSTQAALRSTRQVLLPPKPSEFEAATRIRAGRAWCGTCNNAHSGSGSSRLIVGGAA